MVRTFLVAVRASTAIAVQICANLLSVGLSCVRALERLPKARHVLEAAAKDSLRSCKVSSNSPYLYLVLPTKTRPC